MLVINIIENGCVNKCIFLLRISEKCSTFAREKHISCENHLEGVNNYYKDEWSIMEKSGAVFLRYSCVRNGTILWLIESMSGYWVASYTDETHGVALGYFDDFAKKSRCLGYSVRLVKDL